MTFMRFSYTLIFHALLCSFFIQGQEPGVYSTPNIIIYLADDQNAWDYQIHGNDQVDTSHYDRLVREGMSFSNAYTAQAICAPTRSQLFTGLFPVRNGCMANHLPVKKVKDINDYFSDLGYEVILAGKGHIKPFSVFNWTHFYHTVENRLLPIKKVRKYIQNATKPFCIIFASDLPHGPYPKQNNYTNKLLDYDPSARNSKQNVSRTKSGYYQNIEDDNAQLGRVLRMLKSEDVLDKALFMYMSDHGLKGKWSVRETGIKIPMVVRWPGKVAPQTQSDRLVTIADVLPTLIDTAGGEYIDEVDGRSFLSLLLGDDIQIRDYVYAISTRQNIQKCEIFPSRSVRGMRYKYIRNFNAMEVMEKNLGDNPAVNAFIKHGAQAHKHVPFEELYDLKKDPYEHRNLANNTKYNDIKQQLAKELLRWMTEQGDFLITHTMPLIKPTLHPLDRTSKWNKPDKKLLGTLKDEDYMEVHY
jgi:uncharacterized sulfatase